MFKKIFNLTILMMFVMVGLQSCDSDDPISGGTNPEPELIGCEAADVYDWDTVEFETSLDGGADTWLAFSLEEITYFTVYVSQAGFVVSVFAGCDGEFGAGDTLFQFETIGNGTDIGIVPPGEYWVNILNTRPNRMDFTFRLELSDIIYGCMDENALNYDENANVDAGNCELNDCTTSYWVDNYGEMVNDCDGNCAPTSWIADGYCDDGAWGVYDEEGNIVPVNLWCEEFEFDAGDCEVIPGECPPGQIFDCNANCAPESWLGDTFCDDGSYQFGGNDIFFNCEEFNNDEGDCDGQGRAIQQRTYPNGKIPNQ